MPGRATEPVIDSRHAVNRVAPHIPSPERIQQYDAEYRAWAEKHLDTIKRNEELGKLGYPPIPVPPPPHDPRRLDPLIMNARPEPPPRRIRRPLGYLQHGQRSDYQDAVKHFAGESKLLADKAFDANWIIETLNERGAKVVISQRPQPKAPLDIELEMYKWRHLIENFFCKPKKFKRIARSWTAPMQGHP